jgi:hypothetical protein
LQALVKELNNVIKFNFFACGEVVTSLVKVVYLELQVAVPFPCDADYVDFAWLQ